MKKHVFILLFSCTASVGALAQVNPSNNCNGNLLSVNSTCVLNTYVMDGSFTNSGFNSGCEANTDRDDGWFRFVATASDITVEETSTDRRHMIAVHAACGTNPALACQQSDVDETNVLNLTGLTIGNTYYIHLDRRSGANGSDMNGTICVYETPDADLPWPGADLGTLSCTSTTNATGSTSGAVNDCGVQPSGDHTYQFTTTEITDITIDLCGSSYDTYVYLFNLSNGSCDAGPVASNDDNCGVQSSLVYSCAGAGTYVVVIEGSSGSEGVYDMDITIDNCGCPTPPSNDLPCNAIELTVDNSCITVTGDNTNATASGVAGPGCANYQGGDVWFYAIVPASGELRVETSTAGGITDTGLGFYTGPNCNSLTLQDCDDDGGPGLYSTIVQGGLTPGDTVWFRVWEYGNNAFGAFDICAIETACNGLYTNDYCEDAGTLTENSGSTFASSTASIYTADTPDNVLSEFCGTIQNNSWYIFTATATSHSFNISSVQNCAGSGGIQAEVYSFNTTGGCCNSFNSVSNCFNPGSVATGTVNATGLTIGQDYILMIDGWSGANCDFVISGWIAADILPIEMQDFFATANVDANILHWVTKSEANSKWFIIERSFDGKEFSQVGQTDAAGNSSGEINYTFLDADYYHPVLYYRLKMVDYDLTYEYSEVIRVDREMDQISVHPNPTEGSIAISFGGQINGEFVLTYMDMLGKRIVENVIIDEGQVSWTSSALSDLSHGIYFLELTDLHGNILFTEKILRQ